MPDDTLTLTIRLHDPQEKTDSKKSACWMVVKVDRKDITLAVDAFLAKYVTPNLKQINNLKLT